MASQSELLMLLGRTALRDRKSFKALYDATSPHIYILLLGMLRESAVAQEVLQDTYLRVWLHAADYHSDRGQVNTWIASIARYRALDVIRAGRRVESSDLADEAAVADPDDRPAESAELAGTRAELDECLRELNTDQRQCIALAFFRGLTHDEMSARLGVPLGTVKSWIRRGLAGLRECLQQ